jgi:hypothetical protein
MGLPEKVWGEQYRDLKKQSLAAYQAWTKSQAISIKYVGVEATATAEVKAGTLELCAPALTVVYDLDLSLAAYDTLAELVAYINALADWECALGSQFDGTETSIDLTIAGPTSVKNVVVWFARDTNKQMVITIPSAPAGSELTFTGFNGKSTYSSGASAIEVYDGATLKWSEVAGATTVNKESLLKRYSITAGNALKVKVVNAVEMTAGEMAVAYEIKPAPEFII